MREILFKAKRKDNNEWIEGTPVYLALGMVSIFPIGQTVFETKEIYPETLCQYTGLTDKNGRKVFDGDLVKCLYEDIVNGDYISEIHTCDMKNYYCMIRIISAYEIEVIGNIHDEEEKK